ncbi:MAG: fructokinase [Verrucomicrobiales bacterium]|jgi:fructokinase
MSKLYGAIEAGGTKFVCAVGTGPEEILQRETIPTSTPEVTLERTVSFFEKAQRDHRTLTSIGIASFGPIDCHPGSRTYGLITSTPKEGWANTDFVGMLGHAFHLPIGFDTDVNAAALAEWRWGCARGLSNCLYVTVGTGIGGGFVMNGETLKGLIHPEMGHVRVQRLPADHFEGNCPYHYHECLEGLASGPAMEKRWGKKADALPSDHQAWVWQADYLAQAIVNWIVILSPEAIVLGGGVMQQSHLFVPIRRRVRELLNDYIQAQPILAESRDYIRPPGLGTDSGILGALALAMDAVK